MKDLLEVKKLSISFRTYRGVLEAVHEVSLKVQEGETIGIVGESGCGKSVTAHAIMKLLPDKAAIYDTGTILWEGKDLLSCDEGYMNQLRGKEIAMVFQDPMTSLNPVLTIGTQIAEGLIIHGKMSKETARTRALELLQDVGITSPEKRLHQYPHELSGGMRQRCLIAMALACTPRLLIADEPTTALDVTTEAQVLEMLRSLQEKLGMAVILISHNLGIVAQMCRRVYVMYAGRIVEEGPVEALFASPAHPYTRGLLASLPDPDHKDKVLTGIAGQAPDLFHMPQGCCFYPRCGQAMRICTHKAPPAYDVDAGHQVSCWLYCPERRKE